MKSKTYKTIGILGGMGPAATADLMMKIIDMTEAGCDQDHIPQIIDCNSRIPDRTAAILSGGENPVPEMTASAKRLEAAGADFIIMPCNTAHYFIEDIEKEIGIPMLNMPAEAALCLKRKGVRKAAVLGTDGTVKSGLYGNALAAEGIEAIYPDEDQQKIIMDLIYGHIKKGLLDPAKLPCEEVAAITDDLRARGAEMLLLACTELPLGFEAMGLIADDCIDATSVLAAAAVRAAGAEVKQGSKY